MAGMRGGEEGLFGGLFLLLCCCRYRYVVVYLLQLRCRPWIRIFHCMSTT